MNSNNINSGTLFSVLISGSKFFNAKQAQPVLFDEFFVFTFCFEKHSVKLSLVLLQEF